ncbi:MAG: aldehyde ferredoxin oxidoreductase [Spirochaetes bacterium]|nr:MAG: aldehyde ferredoxin oxidoreductase [Spirochaetota bacterium]
MKGNTGKILHLDLTEEKFAVEKPTEYFYRKYFGGACMGVWYVMNQVPAKTDPLGPENVLAFTISPITGAPVSGNARHCVTTKSPQTGTIAHSEAGGFWGPELKFAGFDGIVITGKASRPVYLWIHDGEYELRDASAIWGKTTGDSQDFIREDIQDNKARVCLIGPGGEKQIRFAGIVNELKHFNGRNGMGAVMGSKNLKAVVVRGSAKPDYHDRQVIKDMAGEAARIVKEDEFYNNFRRCGTTLNVEWGTPAGGLPTRNWTQGTFEEQEALKGERYADEMMDSPGTCFACVQNCKRDVKGGITSPVAIDPRFGGPEYETVGMCGSNLGLGDFKEIAAINQLASMYAVDSISLGGVLGFAAQCFEEGVLTSDQLGGTEPRFGDFDNLYRLAEMVVKREGPGDILAEGTARAAEHWGPEALKRAVHVKNKEFPAHMPHIKGSLALSYAVNPFGPDHVAVEHDPAIASTPVGERLQGLGFYDSEDPVSLNQEKAKLTAYSQRWCGAIDSVSTCSFIFNTWSMFGFEELISLIKAVTGWNYSMNEFLLLGERKLNMMRAFNIREGFTEKDDMLPDRLFETGLNDNGPSAGRVVNKEDFLKAREYYYGICGWDPLSGVPSEYKLVELGLDWALKYILNAS